MSKVYRIGRLSNNDICLVSNEVSRSHAEIICQDNGSFMLTDHSKNGTYVNGRIVHNTSVAVNYGDNILFANKLPLDWSRIDSYTSGNHGSTIVDPETSAPTQNNGMAIAGFVCSFLVPLLGLVFSIIGLNRSKLMSGKGHGLALAGIIISSVLMLFNLVYLLAIASLM